MNKKAITSLVLVGSLIMGGAIGTYAAFRSTAASKESKIKVGKIAINGERDHAELGEWINSSSGVSQIRKPNDAITLNPIEIKNTGSLNMIVKPSIELKYTEEIGGEDKETNMKLDKFMIDPVIEKRGLDTTAEQIKLTGVDGYISLEQFKAVLTAFNGSLTRPDETFVITGNMKLDSSADNTYEGKGVLVKLIVTADQE